MEAQRQSSNYARVSISKVTWTDGIKQLLCVLLQIQKE